MKANEYQTEVTIDNASFSPASRIILIESLNYCGLNKNYFCFSPASRIILIESPAKAYPPKVTIFGKFQSRKQDYFN